MNDNKQTMLKCYIRDSKNNPRGVAIVIREENHVSYGFSLVNSNLDTFSKKIGTTIAINRASQSSYDLPKIEDRESMVLEAYEKLEARALRYWKDLDPDKIKLKGHLSIAPWEL